MYVCVESDLSNLLDHLEDNVKLTDLEAISWTPANREKSPGLFGK